MTLTKWRAANLVSAMALVLAGMSPVLPLQARETAATPATRPTPWLYKGSDVPVDTAWLFGDLDNGLRYAIRHHCVPPGQVSIRVRVDVGSLMEQDSGLRFARSEERCVGKECVRTCNTRWPRPQKKKNETNPDTKKNN